MIILGYCIGSVIDGINVGDICILVCFVGYLVCFFFIVLYSSCLWGRRRGFFSYIDILYCSLGLGIYRFLVF